ncbi:hypothetical protein [Streptodolium elevatio]|uniref:Uncharacterized protein n=1 Tax=Streptodolium elevatio TaxID=3157996 RepID=A0ABV3DJW2_9ACTN
MTAHTRIDAATKAISTAYTEASWRDRDTSHAAAVELEARKLLTETRAQLEREIRAEHAALIQRAIDAHRAEHPFTETAFRLGMNEALRLVLSAGPVVDGSPGDLFDPCDPADGA